MQQETTNSTLAPFPYMHKMQGDKMVEATYLVYYSSGKQVRVQAMTASEAIKKAALPDPIRVLRYDPLSQVLLSGDDFDFTVGGAAEAPVEAAAPAVSDAVEAPVETSVEAPVEASAETSAEAPAESAEAAPAASDAPAEPAEDVDVALDFVEPGEESGAGA